MYPINWKTFKDTRWRYKKNYKKMKRETRWYISRVAPCFFLVKLNQSEKRIPKSYMLKILKHNFKCAR